MENLWALSLSPGIKQGYKNVPWFGNHPGKYTNFLLHAFIGALVERALVLRLNYWLERTRADKRQGVPHPTCKLDV